MSEETTPQNAAEALPEEDDVAVDQALAAEDSEITKPQTVLSNAYRGRGR